MTLLNSCSCRRSFCAGALGAVMGVGSAKAQDRPRAEGDEPDAKSQALSAGAHVLQDHAPVDAMSLYLNGFHFYADDMGRQVEAHHYCTHLNEDLHQCAIFDSTSANARLIGIEYIVSERVFLTLPAEEKRLWHSHDYEVRSGQLRLPGVPEPVERTALHDVVSTYGKTWHTWQVDRGDTLPLGIPQLMMGFTADGQIDDSLLKARDNRLGVSSNDRRSSRSQIAQPAVDPLANAWRSGSTPQLQVSDQPARPRTR